MARFESVLSFSRADDDPDLPDQPTTEDQRAAGYDTDDDDNDAEFEFEFSFAPPLAAARDGFLAPADDLFAHGRILPAFPVPDFDRRPSTLLPDAAASTAPPSPDSYCAWAPRSAPGSPARAFPKSASTGDAARRFWRLRDLLGGGRSHSDGKEKFLFLQPANNASSASKMSKTAEANKHQQQAAPMPKQGNKTTKKKAAETMDMAAAHKLFYGKQRAGGAVPGAAAAADRRQQHSYLPYRTGIVGFFTSAHALGRSHHPY